MIPDINIKKGKDPKEDPRIQYKDVSALTMPLTDYFKEENYDFFDVFGIVSRKNGCYVTPDDDLERFPKAKVCLNFLTKEASLVFDESSLDDEEDDDTNNFQYA